MSDVRTAYRAPINKYSPFNQGKICVFDLENAINKFVHKDIGRYEANPEQSDEEAQI